MKPDPNLPSTSILIPAGLAAADAGEVHASLLAALDLVEAGETKVEIALGDEQSDCAPLALQLLASATRSFPSGTLTLDERGASALATLTHSKDS